MRKILVSLVLMVGGCLAATGCAPKDVTFEQRQQHMTGSLEALRQARFKGSFRFNEGGSILGVNWGGYASLGPQQVTLAVEGEVDFQNDPRPVNPPN